MKFESFVHITFIILVVGKILLAVEEDWDTNEVWDRTFKEHDKIVDNFNMMHDQEDLI